MEVELQAEKFNKIEDLVKAGILKRPEKVLNNPEIEPGYQFLVTIFEEDYPALTPTIENAVFRKFNLDYISVAYLAKVLDLPKIFATFREDPKVLGGGLGVGFKDEAVNQMEDENISSQGKLDLLDTTAEAGGSVNFWLKKEGKLIGYNTDGVGFAESCKEKFKEVGRKYPVKKAVIIGAGGTAGAIVLELARRGFRQIVVLNRTVKKAEEIAERVNKVMGLRVVDFGGRENLEEVKKAVDNADVLINTTNVGAKESTAKFSSLAMISQLPEAAAISKNHAETKEILASLPKDAIVADIVLAKGDTKTIDFAKKASFATLDGKGMVIHQGTRRIFETFSSFFGKKKVSEQDILAIMQKAQFEAT